MEHELETDLGKVHIAEENPNLERHKEYRQLSFVIPVSCKNEFEKVQLSKAIHDAVGITSGIVIEELYETECQETPNPDWKREKAIKSFKKKHKEDANKINFNFLADEILGDYSDEGKYIPRTIRSIVVRTDELFFKTRNLDDFLYSEKNKDRPNYNMVARKAILLFEKYRDSKVRKIKFILANLFTNPKLTFRLLSKDRKAFFATYAKAKNLTYADGSRF